jgi:hypothetical protein
MILLRRPPEGGIDKRGDAAQQAADGGEERAKEDSGRPWRRLSTVGVGDDVKRRGSP